MTKIGMALTFVLAVNIMLFTIQVAMDTTATDYGLDKPSTLFNYEDSMLSDYDSGNYTISDDVVGQLPSGTQSVDPSTGQTNAFTDIFNTFKSWFLDIPGMKYLVGIVNAIPNFLKSTGLPTEFVFAIGAFWHILTLFLLISFMLGKD